MSESLQRLADRVRDGAPSMRIRILTAAGLVVGTPVPHDYFKEISLEAARTVLWDVLQARDRPAAAEATFTRRDPELQRAVTELAAGEHARGEMTLAHVAVWSSGTGPLWVPVVQFDVASVLAWWFDGEVPLDDAPAPEPDGSQLSLGIGAIFFPDA